MSQPAKIATVEPERLTDDSLVWNVHVTVPGDNSPALVLAAVNRGHAGDLVRVINECAHIARAPVEA